ncbi:MAG: hypothetical protein WEF99_07685 [Thermoanaerobaculia bacterium]
MGDIPRRVHKLEIATGKKELWKELTPADPAGMDVITVVPTPDGRASTYDYLRTLSDLYVVHGIK